MLALADIPEYYILFSQLCKCKTACIQHRHGHNLFAWPIRERRIYLYHKKNKWCQMELNLFHVFPPFAYARSRVKSKESLWHCALSLLHIEHVFRSFTETNLNKFINTAPCVLQFYQLRLSLCCIIKIPQMKWNIFGS